MLTYIERGLVLVIVTSKVENLFPRYREHLCLTLFTERMPREYFTSN